MDPVEECSDVRALHRSAARRRCLTAKAHLDIGSAEGCAGKPDMFAELVVDVVEMRLQVRIEKALVHATDDCACQRRSEEHTSELQSLMRISYAVFCLKKKKKTVRKDH